ncbi:META domain-containing protein [Grimontia hollisae]|uniref:Heat shock protein hslJ n=2 Tax=Grimontia hollisae TaxID=673 RepID=A0A377HLV3_GRIHO|nr:META domain-containing protein [Grimontia hollisae]AMG32043.1 META domain-containing protein [Grimontia hollisae]EEY71099.1 putative heat shock protein HslJ [Grimontia hollisae CIP 101886]MDF2184310.1 META domain-containing protein [Grimontia hollisae]STO44061.1 Heat shock protein hslJ [Grimontia hollisae]STO57218.1 Heat shock protein hslJ [Grimontia hollisae]
MKKMAIAMLVAPAILAGCATNTSGNGDAMEVSQANMQHHNWVLESVDGQPLNLPEGFAAPNLEIGESFTANGHGGCNRYFGQAELKGDKFRIDKMASTMMACPEPAMKLETVMTDVLSDWSNITLTNQKLVLENGEHVLTFQLRDWVN